MGELHVDIVPICLELRGHRSSVRAWYERTAPACATQLASRGCSGCDAVFRKGCERAEAVHATVDRAGWLVSTRYRTSTASFPTGRLALLHAQRGHSYGRERGRARGSSPTVWGRSR
jgi:hypothetical protein